MYKHFTPPPQFSIIIPIYNTEKYLRQCIDSVLVQSFTDYELWLIDDGSKDGSIDIINEYASIDPRIHKAFIKGTGPAMPRNYGLERAQGQYILFIDSDDYLLPNALSSFAEIIKLYPEIEFIKGNQKILMDDKKEYESVFKPWRLASADKILSGEELMVSILQTDFTPTNSIFKRKLLVEQNLKFDEKLVLLEDVPFIMELCSISKKCIFNPHETYVYRLFSETSLTRSKRTFPKVISLAQVAKHERDLAKKFKTEGRNLAIKRYTEHSITALFQSCTELARDDSKKVLTEIKKTSPKLPCLGRDIRHKVGIFLYNISPIITHNILRCFSRVIKNK